MVIIGIDGNEANQKIKAGSGVYASYLLHELYSIRNNFNVKFRIYLKDYPLEDMPPESEKWEYKVVGPRILWTQIAMPAYLYWEKFFGNPPGVYFTLSHYVPRFCPVPFALTIYDLSYLKFPALFTKRDIIKLQKWTGYGVKKARKIITISNFSRKEIIDKYDFLPENITVIYPGFDAGRFNPQVKNRKKEIEDIKRKYRISGQYLIYIGTVQPRKNLGRLVEAFDRIRRTIPFYNLKLVITGMIDEGRGGWLKKEIMDKIKAVNGSKESIVLTGYVRDSTLPYLLAGAKFLVLPSLYEGFGIPVLEAMAAGIPSVISNTSSLPELAGHSAIYIRDPYNQDSIVSALKKALEISGNERDSLIESGLRRAQKFDRINAGHILYKTLISLKNNARK